MSSTTARIQAAGVLSLAADLVVESQLARAAVLASASEAVATAVGSAAAAVVLLRDEPSTLFLLNAATFLVSAALIMRVRAVPVRRRAAPGPGSGEDRPAPSPSLHVWPLQATRTIAAYVYGMDVVLLTVVAGRQFGSGSGGYGWLLAATGVGGLLVLVPARRLVGGGAMTANVATGAMLVYALPLLVLALDPPVVGGLGTQVVRGRRRDRHVLGDVRAAVGGAVSLGRPRLRRHPVAGPGGTCVGSIATPVLLDTIGFRATLVVGAAAPCVAQLALHPWLIRFHTRDPHLVAALDPRLSVLRRLDLLRDASRATLYEVADSVSEVTVDSGTVIMAEGGPSDALYVLVSGEVEVTGGPDGRVYRTVSAPGYVGEIGLIQGIPRTATVTAVTSCELWRVPGERFLGAVSEAGVSSALVDSMRVRFDTWPGSGSPALQQVPPRG